MSNMKKFQRILACVMAVLSLCSLMSACGEKDAPPATTEPTAPLSGCTVTVKTEGGMALEGVDVYVYADAAKTEMLSLCKTDKDGKATVAVDVPAGSVAVLQKVPAGYVVEESYPITQADTQIALKGQLLKEVGKITPGNMMFDFTTTDTDGNTHTLSELLKTNKAVMLNLWYENCVPCKSEFPYLQQAYDLYGDGVALLGLNCYAGDDEATVAQFKKDHKLTFPMAKIDSAWEQQIEDMAYPVTIIIDRYGMVSLVHVGGIDDAGVFAGVFQYFTADNYVQSTVADIHSLKIEATNKGEGTESEPLTISGSTEFEVTVQPGATVYCDLYRLPGMVLTVESETVEILYGEQTFLPVDGKVSCLLANSTDLNTPIRVAFTNKGTAEETYKVTMTAPEGSRDNPIVLNQGDFTADIAAGNDQGLFYSYSPSTIGTFVLTVKKAPSVEYSITLNNLTTGKCLTLSENGEEDASGNLTLTMNVNRKDDLQIIVSVDPDSQGKYPAAQVELSVTEKEKETVVVPPTPTPDPDPDPDPDDSEKYNGTLANPDEPVETYGFNAFSVEVGAGQKTLVNIIRVSTTATLWLNDKDAYVVYKEQLYKPDANGDIYIRITGEGNFTPTPIEVGNIGTETKTFDVNFLFDKGTFENPIKLEEGTNTVECAENNETGTYYYFGASEAGTLTLEITNVDPTGVVVGISISDQQSIPTVKELEEGATSVSIELPAGTEALIIFTTKDPTKDWKEPAATITITATFA